MVGVFVNDPPLAKAIISSECGRIAATGGMPGRGSSSAKNIIIGVGKNCSMQA